MLTQVDGPLLAEAFPSQYRPKSVEGGEAAARLLHARQWTNRFAVRVGDEPVWIPARLHFSSEVPPLDRTEGAWGFVRALQTRSNDGYQRQRAARDILENLQPWGAPFIIALLGEYVVQILDDIAEELTAENAQMLGGFIVQNEAYWQTTKRRVMSYWNVYYRSELGSNSRPKWVQDFRPRFKKRDYVGFSLIERLEAAASGRS